MLYKLFIKPFLFLFSPEAAKTHALAGLRLLSGLPLFSSLFRLTHCKRSKTLQRELFGLQFPNPIGLSAGIDQNGDYYNLFSDMGFGFMEIGSLTAGEDKGFPKPRIFRLPKDRAFISRAGIQNKGVKYAIANLQDSLKRNSIEKKRTILIASLGQNSNCKTDAEIIQDYEESFSLLYDFVDMFSVNISCYDQNNVMRLLNAASLAEILDPLLSRRRCSEEYKPIVVKISSDIHNDELEKIIDYCRLSGVDGLIAGGYSRIKSETSTDDRRVEKMGCGCISGAPVYWKTLNMVRYINTYTKGRYPVIASGGIMNASQAREMLEAGASLVQIHSALFYEGPSIVKDTLKLLSKN